MASQLFCPICFELTDIEQIFQYRVCAKCYEKAEIAYINEWRERRLAARQATKGQ